MPQTTRKFRENTSPDVISLETLESHLKKSDFRLKNVFFKSNDLASYTKLSSYFGEVINSNKRLGRTQRSVCVNASTDSLISEFEQLVKMYEILPKNIAIPLCLIKRDGVVIGYLSEYIRGTSIGKLPYFVRKNLIIKQLSILVKVLHNKGLGHGDINIGNEYYDGNVLVNHDNILKLIDPLCSYRCPDNRQRLLQDEENIKSLVRLHRY